MTDKLTVIRGVAYTGGPVTLTVAGALRHLCPVVDEVDLGTFSITYEPKGELVELHALATFLGGFADTRITHEALTRTIRDAIEGSVDPARLTVTTTWRTAGLDYEVTA